ncbi:MAG: dihydroorotase [Flavobacteriales bacterium]|nr:dihydroorotase [Flavobacteriales bacterium]
MDVLIKSAKIISPKSPHHLKTKDVLIEKGKIVKIGKNLGKAKNVIEEKNLCISDGWVDLFSVIREPGNEHQDNIENLLKSAAKGGFTSVLGVSGTTPPLDNKSQIKFVRNSSTNSIVNLLPAGTITENQEGKEITEMYDMHLAGAAAFTDGKKVLKNPELLKRALLYSKPFGGKIICYCEDQTVANGGMINEGEVAASLGMKVRPSLAEELAVIRDLYIAEYTESPIHITGVSTKKSIEIIKEAKSKGIQVTCDVNVANLYFTDQETTSFDANYKLLPPLRSEQDRLALIQGLKDGTIDVISSGHTPKNIETKFCEFDNADFGGVSLEASFGALNKILGDDFSEEEITQLISSNPARILGLNYKIDEGESANITIFSSNGNYTFEKSEIECLSKNSPFIGAELKGKVIGIVNNKKIKLN